MRRQVLALTILGLALTGCSVTNTTTLDPNFKACISAGGTYKEPVSDGIGYSCTLPKGGTR